MRTVTVAARGSPWSSGVVGSAYRDMWGSPWSTGVVGSAYRDSGGAGVAVEQGKLAEAVAGLVLEHELGRVRALLHEHVGDAGVDDVEKVAVVAWNDSFGKYDRVAGCA